MHVRNSHQLDEFYGTLPDQVQTNNREELNVVEAALQLVWGSDHLRFRIFTDYNLTCMDISNDSDEWEALGMDG